MTDDSNADPLSILLAKYNIQDPGWSDLPVGWVALVDDLFAELMELGWNRELSQVKEKYGGLRVYIGAGTKEMFEAIDHAERASLRTCADCGADGLVRDYDGWLATKCEEHSGVH